ncbi:hypothetical protein BpHYR1_006311 [Brachionus plicatilis]|uniref:Uncharacterized protein n=1 Tax=Brachionus plicatilis TaxID=10195 RepID=A0A3M7RMA1_BRAPC|nr:hypothetical protein BpHYR1_006311 [Brachionus plicatilis]
MHIFNNQLSKNKTQITLVQDRKRCTLDHCYLTSLGYRAWCPKMGANRLVFCERTRNSRFLETQ